MLTHFPQAVPEIPVSNVEKAAEYYVIVLGFNFDWGNDEGGIAGISQGECRMFLANAAFHQGYGTGGPVMIWLNLNSKARVQGRRSGRQSTARVLRLCVGVAGAGGVSQGAPASKNSPPHGLTLVLLIQPSFQRLEVIALSTNIHEGRPSVVASAVCRC